MFKRLLCVLTVCALLLGMVPAFAAETEVIAETYELLPASYEIVTGLGICEYTEKEFGDTISRGEFAKFVSLLGGFGEGNKSANMFSDVPADHEYAGYINGLAKAGIVSGYNGAGYSPDALVSMNEAIATVIRAMGYTAKAEYQGGYPYGYAIVAQRLGVLENLKASSAPITKAEAIQLAFNALETDAMVADGVIEGKVSYGVYKDYTFGEYVFGMDKLTGIVEAVDISSIQGENELDSEEILIDGVKILAEEKILWDYLGYEVDAWYIPTSRGINKLVHIEKTNYNKVTVIPVTDIVSISKGKVEYYDENNEKETVEFKIAGPVIYNNAATYEAFNMDMFEFADGGTVTMVSNDGNKICDVIMVEAYTDYVVSALYSTEMTLYDKFVSDRKIKLDTTVDEPYTIIYNHEGEEITFDSVEVGNVVSVYASMNDADQKFIKCVVHSDYVEGVVSEVSYVDGVAEVTVDGMSYRLTQRCFDNRQKFVQTGAALRLVLNTEGKVCDLVSVSSGLEFVYLIALDEGKGINKKLSVKVLKMDGSFVVYELGKNVTVDTNVYKDGYRGSKYILEALVESSKVVFPNSVIDNCIAQPVQIRVSDGKITSFDTVLNSNGDKAVRTDVKGFDMLYHVGSVRGSQSSTPGPLRSNNYAGKFIADSKTPTISIPSVESADTAEYYLSEEEYSFTTPSASFPDNSNIRFFADAFSTKDDSFGAEYIITTKGSGAIGENTFFSIVKDVRSAILPDETVGYCVVVEYRGAEEKIYFEDDYKFKIGTEEATPGDLIEGDLIRYAVNARGFVSDGMEFCFRTETGDVFSDLNSKGEFAQEANALTYGYVHQALSDGFTFLEGSLKQTALETVPSEDLTLAGVYGSIYIYDFNEVPGKRIKPAKADDIMGYSEVGTDGSFIYLNANRCRAYMTLIVNGHDYNK